MRIYSIKGGRLIITFISIESLICFICGIIVLPRIESLYFVIFSIIFALLCVFFIFLKYINYIEITDKGVYNKKTTFSWDDVYITADCLVPFWQARGRSYTYQLFFSDRYLFEKKEKTLCRKSGLFIYLDKKRLYSILAHYKKQILIAYKSPDQTELFDIMNNHNKKY